MVYKRLHEDVINEELYKRRKNLGLVTHGPPMMDEIPDRLPEKNPIDPSNTRRLVGSGGGDPPPDPDPDPDPDPGTIPQSALDLGWNTSNLSSLTTDPSTFGTGNVDLCTDWPPYPHHDDTGHANADAQSTDTLPVECPTPRTLSMHETLAAPMIEWLNKYRYSRGLGPVTYSDHLSQAAQTMASYMYDNDYLGHESPGDPRGGTMAERINWTGFPVVGGSQQESNAGLNQTFQSTQSAVHGLATFFVNNEIDPLTCEPVDPSHLKGLIDGDYDHIGYAWKGGKKSFVGAKLDTTQTIPPLNTPIFADPDLTCA